MDIGDKLKVVRLDGKPYFNDNDNELVENNYAVLYCCYEEFKLNFFDDNTPVSCKLFDICGDDADMHVAPACNIADAIYDVQLFLKSIGVTEELKDESNINKYVCDTHIKIYITLLFYIYEQLNSIHNSFRDHQKNNNKRIASLDYIKDNNFNKLFESDDNQKNDTIALLKCYVNFYKHPKSASHTHHPELWSCYKDSTDSLIIKEGDFTTSDFQEFFLKSLTSKKTDSIRKMNNKLYNKKGVRIILEDLSILTRDFGKFVNDFIKFYSSNEEAKNFVLNELCVDEL